MKDKVPPSTFSLGFGITSKPKAAAGRVKEVVPPAERKAKITVVEPDAESRRFINTRLSTAGYEVEVVETARDALDACVRNRPNLVITDLHLEAMDGLALLRELKSRWPSMTVIILTAHGTIAQAVEATQAGAFGFLVKPVEKAELLGQVERAIAASTFTLVDGNWRAHFASRSQLMEDRLSIANKAAASDDAVLLTGENGTGKELLARAIHAASRRRDKPFVVVNCGKADVADLEQVLFGAVDAVGTHGQMAAADGGTLLLEEVGALPSHLQLRLSTALRKSPDMRVICTTSRDLKLAMEGGGFRQDLYYQINILPIEIPPLGRRREDIPLLVSHFLEQATEGAEKKKIYSPDAIELLSTTDWPGNVRQLFELVKQNVALSHGKIMTKEFVQQSLGREGAKVPTYDEARDEFALAYLKSNLQSTAGNVSQAARLAKRNRTDFYKLLARHRLQPDDFKNQGGPHKKSEQSGSDSDF